MDERVGADIDQDREVQAMALISRALDGLEPQTAARVVRWVVDRYRQAGSGGSFPDSPDRPGRVQFTDVASLYDAANPLTEAEKVLVVGYWMQVFENVADLDAQAINAELKQLGHGVTNITTAFRNLMHRSPRLALQIRKSGPAKQARKKYRLTNEGVRRVDEMIGNQPSNKE